MFVCSIAKYNLKKYTDALLDLEQGRAVAEKESDAKKKMFDDWISKCKKELPVVVEAPQKVVEEVVVPVVPAVPHRLSEISN